MQQQALIRQARMDGLGELDMWAKFCHLYGAPGSCHKAAKLYNASPVDSMYTAAAFDRGHEQCRNRKDYFTDEICIEIGMDKEWYAALAERKRKSPSNIQEASWD